MNTHLRRKLHSCAKLPSPPAVALEVLDICRQPDFDMSDLANAIRKDPALCARVLKVVNSPLFSLRREVTSIQQAVTWLGAQSVRTISLSFSLVTRLRESEQGGFDHCAYWKRSFISAMVAGKLVREQGGKNWEEAFLGALLQDLGMLALSASLGSEYNGLTVDAQGDHLTLAELERERLDASHATIAAWLAEDWSLPQLLQHCLRHSHATTITETMADRPQDRLILQAVALSGWIADIWVRNDTRRATEHARRRAASLMQLHRDDFDRLLEEVAEEIPDAAALFDADLGAPQEIHQILEQAREHLVDISFQNMQRAIAAEQTVGQLRERAATLEDRARRDTLTGLYNRGIMEEVLASEFSVCRRLDRPLSILFCDIDHFKSVNDNHGHQAGDRVLVTIAELIQSCLRDSDVVARYGGEEFVVILPRITRQNARHVADKIRERIAREGFQLACGTTLRCTISIGGATADAQRYFSDTDRLLDTADKCLYAAKRAGRNRVVMDGDTATRLSMAG